MTAQPTPTTLVTAWTWQPLAIAAAVVLTAWYLRRTRELRPGQIAVFLVGVVVLVWGTCGFPGVYIDDLFYVWTAQQLGLLLIVPYLLLAGGPLQLAGRPVQRFLSTRFVRA